MSVVSRWRQKLARRKSALAKTKRTRTGVRKREVRYLKKYKEHVRRGKQLRSGTPAQEKNKRSRLWYEAHYLASRARRKDLDKLERSQAAAVAAANRVIRRHQTSLRERAWKVAESLVGVMEAGGNNNGPVVAKIIHANGGSIGEPWCGDFVAWCYREAGSSRVQRSWASVALLGTSGSGTVPALHPERGDIVRYTFSHTGLFGSRVNGSTIQTIEGNTGASGAVSDSKTGGDGVYRKNRSTSLVDDYRSVKQ